MGYQEALRGADLAAFSNGDNPLLRARGEYPPLPILVPWGKW
jgi:hypothetical protein